MSAERRFTSRSVAVDATLRSHFVSAGCDPTSRWDRRGRIDVGPLTRAAQAYRHLVVVGRREPYFDTSVSAAVVPGSEFAEIIELGRVSDLGDPSEGNLAICELKGYLAGPAVESRRSTSFRAAVAS
jgi:hypothetical protein